MSSSSQRSARRHGPVRPDLPTVRAQCSDGSRRESSRREAASRQLAFLLAVLDREATLSEVADLARLARVLGVSGTSVLDRWIADIGAASTSQRALRASLLVGCESRPGGTPAGGARAPWSPSKESPRRRR